MKFCVSSVIFWLKYGELKIWIILDAKKSLCFLWKITNSKAVIVNGV